MTPGARASSRIELTGQDWAPVVDGAAERIDHTADQRLAYGHRHNAAGAADFIAFLNYGVVAEEHGADLIFFEVQRDAGNVVRELDQFAGHHGFETVNTRDAVAYRDNEPGFRNANGAIVIFNLFAENSRYLVCSNLSHIRLILLRVLSWATNRSRIVSNCERTEPSYTVEPIRATTPPIKAGSIEKSHRTCLPERRDNSLL